MPILTWDSVGDRKYESGLDRGVLYLPGCIAVPWNGLTSIIEKFDRSASPVYYDGMKINDLVSLGDFEATMKAVTYPDEFEEVEGLGKFRNGLFAGDQPPKVFGLCYRTMIGNDLEGDEAGYKIHILYNVTAIPSEKTYASRSADPSLVEFQWDIYATPEELPGFRPTAHFIINSIDFDPWLLQELETMLYGDESQSACLLPMTELVAIINDWYRVKIIDHGDGTWSAIADRAGFIFMLDDDEFKIVGVNAVYLTEDLYEISDTIDGRDVPQIAIIDNGDGTWTASTSHDNLIIMTGPDTFEIRNANATYFPGSDSYQISDTIDET